MATRVVAVRFPILNQKLIKKKKGKVMEIIGKVIEVLDVVSGENENGEWRRGGFVVETLGDYPSHLMLELSGDRLDTIKPNHGQIVKAKFSVSSRKIGDRWYTNARCFEMAVY